MYPVPPSFLETEFLEHPYVLSFVLGVAALLLAVIAKRTEKRGLSNAALIVVAVIPVLWGIAKLIDSPREQLTRATRAFVATTDPIDTNAMTNMLRPEIVVAGPDDTDWLNYPQLILLLTRWKEEKLIGQQEITDLLAQATSDTEGVALLSLKTNVGAFGVVPSTWLIQWRRDAKGQWRVSRIRCESVAGQKPSRGELPF